MMIKIKIKMMIRKYFKNICKINRNILSHRENLNRLYYCKLVKRETSRNHKNHHKTFYTNKNNKNKRLKTIRTLKNNRNLNLSLNLHQSYQN